LPSGPGAWTPTSNSYLDWRVCGLSNMILLTDIPSLFTPAQLAEINRLTPGLNGLNRYTDSTEVRVNTPPAKPLQGKWVPVRSVDTDRGSGAKMDFRVFEPRDIPPGWKYFGQSYNGSPGLIVRKSEGALDDVFCSVGRWDPVWNVERPYNDFAIWNPVPEDPAQFSALTSTFCSNEPVHQAPLPNPSLACINKKYLVKGQLGSLIWDSRGTGAETDVVCYGVEGQGINVGGWQAVGSYQDEDLQGDAWLINPDFIEIL